jgi:cytoskeletal protein CcmA (bactofilin family)
MLEKDNLNNKVHRSHITRSKNKIVSETSSDLLLAEDSSTELNGEEHVDVPIARLGAADQYGLKMVAYSFISSDLTISGDLKTDGELHVEGTVEGDIVAGHVYIAENATVIGMITADNIIVHGKTKGLIRGGNVLLSRTAQVEGDIIHTGLSIESCAGFEGSVQRAESLVAEQETSTGDQTDDESRADDS